MVFVSYSYRNLDVAEAIAQRLEEAGAECVRANLSRIPDDQLTGTIHYYLHLSSHSIVIVSGGVSPSPWVSFEAGFALGLRHPLFVLGSGDDALPPFLAEWPTIPDLAALDQFIRVYQESTEGWDQSDKRMLKNVDGQNALQFENFRMKTWSSVLKDNYMRSINRIDEII